MTYEEQIQDLLDSNDDFNRQYFVWRIDHTNKGLINFFESTLMYGLDETVIALMQHTEESYFECETLIENHSYLVLTDDEADVRFRKYAEMCCEEAKGEFPSHLREYFDESKYIDDIMSNCDRGVLDYYDRYENVETVNGTDYYIYRQ